LLQGDCPRATTLKSRLNRKVKFLIGFVLV